MRAWLVGDVGLRAGLNGDQARLPAIMWMSRPMAQRAGRRLAGCGIGRMSPTAAGRYDQPVTKDELLARCLSKPGGQLIIRWELQNDSANLLWVAS